MAVGLLATALLESVRLTASEALSGVFGSISLASGIFILVPQLVENYKLQSADGVSISFLTVWFIGDITNLVGALWAGLIPTIIVIAVYFCFIDLVLILQCLYYNKLNARRQARKLSTRSVESEEEPLLNRRNSDAAGLPDSRRRRSSAADLRRRRRSSLSSNAEQQRQARLYAWLKNISSVLAICALGAGGWAIAWKTRVWRPQPVHDDPNAYPMASMAPGAQVLGYISAICYLSARIPQIIKNQRDRSCEGLSLLVFLLSILGNATYGAAILFHSTERQYVLTNLPWLIGSLGTMAQDGIIFVQFRVFGAPESAVTG